MEYLREAKNSEKEERDFCNLAMGLSKMDIRCFATKPVLHPARMLEYKPSTENWQELMHPS